MSQSGFSEEVSSTTDASSGNKVDENTGGDISHIFEYLSLNTDCSSFGGSSIEGTEGGRGFEGVDSQGGGLAPATPLRHRRNSSVSSQNLEVPSSDPTYHQQFEGQPQEQDAVNSVVDFAIYVPKDATKLGRTLSGSKRSHDDDQEDKGGDQKIRIAKRRLSQPRRLTAQEGSPSGHGEDPYAMEGIERTEDNSMN